MSKEFTHQFLCVTVSPIKGTYGQNWWEAVLNVMNTHYVHYYMCEEKGKSSAYSHLHVAIYTDEQPVDRVRANVSQRVRRAIRQLPGYDAYRTFKVELHANAYPFGYCQKESGQKCSSASDQIDALLEAGLEDYANAPDLKAKAQEDQFRVYCEETVEILRAYCCRKYRGPSNVDNRDYEVPYHPHKSFWRASALAAQMFRDSEEGMDSKRYRWVTRNAVLVNSYFIIDITEAENYEEYTRTKRKEEQEERAYLGKKAREAEKPSPCCKASRWETPSHRWKCGKCGRMVG